MASAGDSRTTNKTSRQKSSNRDAREDPLVKGALEHAVAIIYRVCCLAGAADLIDEIGTELRAERVPTAIRRHDTGLVFDWLMAAFSYQGLSDKVATDYMATHGRARWHDINAGLAANPTCPKLKSFWHFAGCRYDKTSRTCAEPDHIDACPLPRHDLRNGRLNQTVYSLFLFARDIADSDLIGWIDARVREAAGRDDGHCSTRAADRADWATAERLRSV
jgi:hypothetical protein